QAVIQPLCRPRHASQDFPHIRGGNVRDQQPNQLAAAPSGSPRQACQVSQAVHGFNDALPGLFGYTRLAVQDARNAHLGNLGQLGHIFNGDVWFIHPSSKALFVTLQVTLRVSYTEFGCLSSAFLPLTIRGKCPYSCVSQIQKGPNRVPLPRFTLMSCQALNKLHKLAIGWPGTLPHRGDSLPGLAISRPFPTAGAAMPK